MSSHDQSSFLSLLIPATDSSCLWRSYDEPKLSTCSHTGILMAGYGQKSAGAPEATATRLVPTRAGNTSQLSSKDCAVVQTLISKYNLDDAASFQEHYKDVFYSLEEQEALELLYAWVVELCGGQALVFATPHWWPKTIHHTSVEDLTDDDRKKLLLHILCEDHKQDIQRKIPFKVPFKKLFGLLQNSSVAGSRKLKVGEVFALRKFEILNEARLREVQARVSHITDNIGGWSQMAHARRLGVSLP